MSRRFVPPAVAAFGDGPEAELARTLAGAREEGFAEGRSFGQQEGHAAGLREGEERAAAAHRVELDALHEKFAKHVAVMTIAEALERVLDARAADLHALEDATRTAMVAALDTVFPTLRAVTAGSEIIALLSDALADRPADTLTLRAHPDTLAIVTAQGFPGTHADRLTLRPDASLAASAAELGWTGGGLSFDPAELNQRVAALLSPTTDATKDVRA